MNAAAFTSTQHIVVLMLENRSFDHMLGFLYSAQGNKSPNGQPFEGLTGEETNPDSQGNPVAVFKIAATDQNAYFMPGADPGEGRNWPGCAARSLRPSIWWWRGSICGSAAMGAGAALK
jgi:phospholipase C